MPRTDTAARTIDAPPDVVYQALVERATLVEWLPPAGMSARFERFDLRPGGGYRLVLTYDDPAAASGKATADSDVVEARIVQVVAGERVVQAIDFESDDPAFAGTMTMTWSVAPSGDGCVVEIRADDVPPGITADDHQAGMSSSLDQLATYVTKRARHVSSHTGRPAPG